MSDNHSRSKKMQNAGHFLHSGLLQQYQQACQERLQLQEKICQLLPEHIANDCQIVLNQHILTLFLPQKLSSFWQRFQNETLLKQIQNLPGCEQVQKLKWKIGTTTKQTATTTTAKSQPQSLAPNVRKSLLSLSNDIQHEKLKQALANLANIGKKTNLK